MTAESEEAEVLFSPQVLKCVTGVTGSGLSSCRVPRRSGKQEIEGNAAHWCSLDSKSVNRLLSARYMLTFLVFGLENWLLSQINPKQISWNTHVFQKNKCM